ncbi:MAG: radical SAM protein [Elusimicrobia bacterium]|nr:radical SAM protein [Elusimicrobiota bacterium]
MIVFVDPPSPEGFVAFRHSHGGYGECCKTSRLRVPTLDIFLAASRVLEAGREASVVDSVLEGHGPEECVAEILRRRPTAVALRTAVGSRQEDLAVAELLRARFDGPIVFFGPAAQPSFFLASSAVDGVLAGEGIEPFVELARRPSRRAARALAAGPMDLERLPVPRWDLVDYRSYSYVTAQSSWGCPFRCGYCPYPVTQGPTWRARPIPAVVEEFRALRDRYGLRFVLLRDPEFTLDRRRAAALCEALLEAGTPILWGCETRLDTLDDELIDRMARAGCMRVAFGVESVEPAILAAQGRRALSPAAIRRRVGALKRRGMLTYAMYIIGLPGETEASARRTADFALELDTNAASFSLATPFPGTRLERRAKSDGLSAPGEPRMTSCVPTLSSGPLAPGEAERLYLEAKARWKRHKGESRSESRPFALS